MSPSVPAASSMGQAGVPDADTAVVKGGVCVGTVTCSVTGI